jgi:Co/Zn/Cd efflux system component
MFRAALAWLGFAQPDHHHPSHHGPHDHAGQLGHTHGVIDPTLATTERGIWAIKWSFVLLALTAALQLAVVLASGSVALFADTMGAFKQTTRKSHRLVSNPIARNAFRRIPTSRSQPVGSG